MVNQTIIILVSAVAGVGVRTLYKYLQKIAAGEIVNFDAKFAATALLSLITVLTVAIGITLTYQVPETATTNLLLVLSVFSSSYTINDIANTSIPTSPTKLSE